MGPDQRRTFTAAHRRVFKAMASVAVLFTLASALTASPSSADVANNAADYVFGQSGSYTTGTTSTAATGFNSPRATAIDPVHHRMFVAEKNNNRVLIYNLNSDNSIPDATADYSLGSSNPSSSGAAAATPNYFNAPSGIAIDTARNLIYIADSSNARVLVFDGSVLANGMNATYVLGQATFTTSTGATTQSGLSGPAGVAVDSLNQRVYVADNANHRVMVFDSSVLSNGMNASFVIGQSSFTTSTLGSGATGMAYANAVAVDTAGNRLYVADGYRNRTMVYDTTALATGMSATYALGQSSLTATTAATTQAGEFAPGGVIVGAGYVFVSDSSNRRVVGYLIAGLVTGEAASIVFGQADFVSSAAATTQTGLAGGPSGLGIDSSGARLYVVDTSANRVLMYNIYKQTATVNIAATVDPTFTFAIANQASACNGESNFISSAGMSTAISLSHVGPAANVSGGQALSVASNAGSGFAVYLRGTQAAQNLRSPSYNWTDVAGTYASPAALGSNEAFGYTYKDSSASSSVINPGSALFAALDNNNQAIMGSISSPTGTGCISFDAKTSATTPAGSYSAVVVYTAIPSY